MDQQSGGAPLPLPSQEPPTPKRDFFDVYKVAIDDLHRTRNLGQKIDSLYVTILTLLLTADAYELATTKFDSWVPVAATAGVAFIGLAINGRWRKGASNLFRIITNRYAWLREAETHPEMQRIAANIFTQEYAAIYLPQMNKKEQARVTKARDQIGAEPGFSMFYHRTVFLQSLCPWVFLAVPVILAMVTYLNLNTSLLQTIGRIISGK